MAKPAKPAGKDLRDIPLELIDEPARPSRETMDEDKLMELVVSVQQLGVIEPIVVEAIGGRFRIHAGHRRFCAAVAAELKTIPAVVYPEGQLAGEEASFFARLLEEECGGDVDRLCELVRQKRGYVEGRLLLLQGDPEVFACVKAKGIGVTVARELNAVKDQGMRRVFLDAARKGGASARMVQQWRLDNEKLAPVAAPDTGPGDNQYSTVATPQTSFACLLCEGTDEPWDMELIYMHRRCRKITLDRFLAKVKGEPYGEAPAQPAAAENGH